MLMSRTVRTESVWDYPRPPVVDPDDRLVRVSFERLTIAESSRTVRILETSHPPVFYIPPQDVELSLLSMSRRSSFCEFKGEASYWDLPTAGLDLVGWSYANPSPGFETIRDWMAFYPSKVECYVDGEQVQPQEGDFYGGWITPEIRGPFKGGPGTWGW